MNQLNMRAMPFWERVLFVLIIFVIVNFTSCDLARGQLPEQKPGSYVSDYAKVLSDAQVKTLNDSILSLEKSSSVQVAIVVIQHLPANKSIEDFSRELGNKWRVGRAGNGAIFVNSVGDRKTRMDVAKRLEGTLTDYDSKRILNDITPFLKEGDYFEAYLQMIKDVKDVVKPDSKEQLQLYADQKNKSATMSRSDLWTRLYIILAIVLIIFLVIGFVVIPKQKRKRAEQKRLDEEEEERFRKIRREDRLDRKRVSQSFGMSAFDADQRSKREFHNPPLKKADKVDDTELLVSGAMLGLSASSADDGDCERKKDDDTSSSSSKSDDISFGSFGNDAGGGFTGGGASGDY